MVFPSLGFTEVKGGGTGLFPQFWRAELPGYAFGTVVQDY